MTYRERLRKIAATGPLRTGSRLRVCELLCIQVALQPRREFTCAEFMEQWGISGPSSMWKSAMALESRGLLTVKRGKYHGGKKGMEPHLYSAGPEMLVLIGLLSEDKK